MTLDETDERNVWQKLADNFFVQAAFWSLVADGMFEFVTRTMSDIRLDYSRPNIYLGDLAIGLILGTLMWMFRREARRQVVRCNLRVRLAQRLGDAIAGLKTKTGIRHADLICDASIYICDKIVGHDGYWPAHCRTYAIGRLTENNHLVKALRTYQTVPEVFQQANIATSLLNDAVVDEKDLMTLIVQIENYCLTPSQPVA